MDLSSLIPITAVAIGIPGFVAFVALMMGHTRKMKELEIRELELQAGGSDASLGPVVDALSSDLHGMRSQVTELQERLDFAERLLTSGKSAERS